MTPKVSKNDTLGVIDRSSGSSKLRGAEGFERYYANAFGSRWDPLKAALMGGGSVDRGGRSRADEGRVVRENGFSDPAARRRAFEGLEARGAPGCRRFERSRPICRDQDGLMLGYVMDAASVLAARALPLHGAECVLDLCAAPGGKALILAEDMEEGAHLVLNDRSPDRRARLIRVLRDYLPSRVRERITVTGHDGRKVGVAAPDAYDAILLDAPCSSEAHVLGDAKALGQWSESRSERLAKDQYALLTSCLGALKPGGTLVYCTCALCPQENDGVIERLLKKRRHPVTIDSLHFEVGEPTEHGWQFLPDVTGLGPLYLCRLVSRK